MFDGAAEFGGVVEKGGIFFVEHSGGCASPEAVAQSAELGADTMFDQQEAGDEIGIVKRAGRGANARVGGAGVF